MKSGVFFTQRILFRCFMNENPASFPFISSFRFSWQKRKLPMARFETIISVSLLLSFVAPFNPNLLSLCRIILPCLYSG